ncbi:MAG TPA: YicC/YloC family endoribonuclease, partial [Candidatus Limnocylindria bacterium]|nr:YicC/YloC family endoribonuclease [Candidatus Limnocylindria bacterium]
MLRSMTGFAARTISLSLGAQGKTNISISIKSLNSRFFEATCKLQYQLNSLEIELTRVLQRMLHRGHIYLTIQDR